MESKRKELAVAALASGTVIDHIPSDALFKVVQILGLDRTDKPVTIGCNLASKQLGSKGIVKIAETFFDDATLNRIALIAPQAVINIIKEYNVVEKRRVELPDSIVGIVKCHNPKCVTNNEPMDTRFDVIARDPVVIRCHYCNHATAGDEAKIMP